MGFVGRSKYYRRCESSAKFISPHSTSVPTTLLDTQVVQKSLLKHVEVWTPIPFHILMKYTFYLAVHVPGISINVINL